MVNLDNFVNEVCSFGCDWYKVIFTGLDNALAQDRWQAIISISDDPVQWCIHVALGEDALIHWFQEK